jgi:hypothetical protein
MTGPGILLSIFIASILALVFHLFRGGGVRRLGLYLIAANISFFIGHFIGSALSFSGIRVGSINLIPAVLAAILGLSLTSILAPSKKRTTRMRGKHRKRK